MTEFKIGDEVEYVDLITGNIFSTVIKNITTNKETFSTDMFPDYLLLWGDWSVTKNGVVTNLYLDSFIYANQCTLVHRRVLYDPNQQPDTEEDI